MGQESDSHAVADRPGTRWVSLLVPLCWCLSLLVPCWCCLLVLTAGALRRLKGRWPATRYHVGPTGRQSAIEERSTVGQHRWSIAFIGLVLALWASVSVATEEPKIVSPEEIPGSTKVDAEGLIDLVGRLTDLTLVDSRIATDRAQGHIEGSVSLPDEKTSCDSLGKVLSGKDTPVLFYCNGPKCGRSAVAVRIALQCGYSSIYWFRGGFEEWKHKKFPYIKE